MTLPEPSDHTYLVLLAVADPITRHGHPARPAAVRTRHALKRLLRSYGLKAVICRNPTPEQVREARGRLGEEE